MIALYYAPSYALVKAQASAHCRRSIAQKRETKGRTLFAVVEGNTERGILGEQQQLSFNKKKIFFGPKASLLLSHAHDLLLFSPTRTAAERWWEKATAFENITFCLFCSLFYENLHMWCWCTTTQLRDDISVIESLGGKKCRTCRMSLNLVVSRLKISIFWFIEFAG